MLSKGLHEIVLVVREVPRAARFYREVLGLIPISEPTDEWASFATVSSESKQWLGLTKGPLLFEEYSPRPEGQRFGPVHFAFQGDVGKRDAFLAKAKANGITVHGPHSFRGRMEGESYYFYDPDDNLVELWFPS